MKKKLLWSLRFVFFVIVLLQLSFVSTCHAQELNFRHGVIRPKSQPRDKNILFGGNGMGMNEPFPDAISLSIPKPDLPEHFDASTLQLRENSVDLQGNIPSTIPTAAPTTKTTTNYDFKPQPCIEDESEIVYVKGIISPSLTFINCLKNVADIYSIPTFYNGSVKGVMLVYNSIQLNNLHSVSDFIQIILTSPC